MEFHHLTKIKIANYRKNIAFQLEVTTWNNSTYDELIHSMDRAILKQSKRKWGIFNKGEWFKQNHNNGTICTEVVKRITILTIYSNLFKGQQVQDVLEEFLLLLVILINSL